MDQSIILKVITKPQLVDSKPEGVADNERCARFNVPPLCPNNPYGFPPVLPEGAPECYCK